MTDLPEDVRAAAERLTHRARRADDEASAEAHRARRDELLADHGFRARVRDEREAVGSSIGANGQPARADREVLVLYPEEWLDDGTVRTDRIDDLDRAVEIPLSGPGDPDDWDAVEDHNREVVARVRRRYGDVHGDNAAALADFAGNHYAKRVEDLTDEEIEEFLTEYFPRNAWPSEQQREAVEESVELTAEGERPGK